MSPQPITKVYDADGTLVHDCADAGCTVSWDGYVLADGYQVEQPDTTAPDGVKRTSLAAGERVPHAVDPGDGWRCPGDGTARLLGS